MSSINSISAEKLSRLIGRPDSPVLIDVRTDEDFVADPHLIPGSVRRSWESVAEWAHAFKDQSAVVICHKGLK
ncbi:rhodanese-like domain-containing protein, partial [Corallococcus exiguus]|uniref:rhodanese-like domain-containing protein n=1 Tax=Corallococcus exiguus TaxID=83462 RepID=UPI001B8D2856